MGYVDRPVFGWIVWDKLFSHTNLAVNDGTELGSSYSQLHPRPGIPTLTSGTDDAQVQVSGAQGVSIDVRVRSTGMPGIDDAAAGLVVRDPDGDNTWLTWNADRFNRWEMVRLCTSGGTTYETLDVETHRISGRVAMVGRRQAVYWDEASSAWVTAGGSWSSSAVAGGVALCSLSTGRMLAISKGSGITTRVVRYSDDGGQSWAVYATESMPTTFPKNTSRLAAATHGDNVVLFAEASDGSGDLYQLASTDEGASYFWVQTMTSKGQMVSVCELGLLGVGVVYQRTGDSMPVFARLDAATRELSGATEVEIDGAVSGVDGLAMWCTPDGMLFVLMSDRNGDGTELRVYRSTDVGETWEAVSEPGHFDDNPSLRLVNMSATWGPNGAVIAHNLSSLTAGDRDLSLCALWLGGWSNLEQATGPQYTGGSADADQAAGGLWLPVDTFVNSGWAVTFDGGGAEALEDGCRLTDGVQIHYPASRTSLSTRYLFDVQVHNGGNPASDVIFCKFRWGNGTTTRRYLLRLSDSGGWRLYDDLTSVELVSDLTYPVTQRTQFRVGPSEIQVKRPHERVWSVFSFTGTTTADTLTGAVTYEQLDLFDPDVEIFGIGFDESSNTDYTNVDGFRGRPTSGIPIWLPPLGGVEGSRLALVDGPATSGTEWRIDPLFDYGVHRIDPSSGSPTAMWLSGESSEQIITWDLGAAHLLPSTWLGLYVERPRFREAYLEYHDGTDWQEAAYIDVGTDFAGMQYLRAGDSLVPGIAVANPAQRYLQSGELVGGWALYGTSAYAIGAQRAGSWAASGGARPVVQLGSGGEDPGGSVTGTCTLLPPQAYTLADVGFVSSRYWRLRIPAQSVPQGGIGCGAVLVGTLHAVGAEPGWSWSEGNDPNVVRGRTPWGTPTSAQLGPSSKSWTWGWTEGQILTSLRSSLEDIDYLSPEPDGSPVVADGDVWWQLEGLLEVTEGGTLPCVALRVAGGDGETITDPTRMILCEVESGPAVQGLAGQEGRDEAVRVESVTMRRVR